jgi:hypothetical protein
MSTEGSRGRHSGPFSGASLGTATPVNPELAREDEAPLPEPIPRDAFSERAIRVCITALTWTLAALLARKAWSDLDAAWDSLVYHLPFAALRAGLMTQSDYRLSELMASLFGGIPALSAYLQGWAWRLTSHVQAANLVGFAGLLLLALLLRRWHGVAATDVLFCSLAIPVILIGATSAYDDLWVNSVTTGLLMLLYFALVRPAEFSAEQLLTALLAFALVMNSKLQFTVVGTLTLAGLLATLSMGGRKFTLLERGWKTHGAVTRAAFVLVGILLIAAGYANCAKNWITHGNPVYPVALDFGPIHWTGIYHTVGAEPINLAHTPQPVRWLISVAEFDAFDGRRPLWTNSQGDINNQSHALRMGGFYSTYVALNLLWFAWLQRRLAPRFGRKPAIFLSITTILTALLPASQELRYYSYWMLTLVSINLALIALLPVSERSGVKLAFLAGAGACLLFVLGSSGGQYVRTQGMSPDHLVRSLGIQSQLSNMNLRPGESVCGLGKQPLTFLYAPMFNEDIAARTHYHLLDAYTQADCSGNRVIP